MWEGLDEPVQVVQRKVELPFEVIDWRSLPASEQQSRLDDVLGEDRGRGFDPQIAAPGRLGITTMRQRAVRVGGEMHIWSRPGAGTQIEVVIP